MGLRVGLWVAFLLACRYFSGRSNVSEHQPCQVFPGARPMGPNPPLAARTNPPHAQTTRSQWLPILYAHRGPARTAREDPTPLVQHLGKVHTSCTDTLTPGLRQFRILGPQQPSTYDYTQRRFERCASLAQRKKGE